MDAEDCELFQAFSSLLAGCLCAVESYLAYHYFQKYTSELVEFKFRYFFSSIQNSLSHSALFSMFQSYNPVFFIFAGLMTMESFNQKILCCAIKQSHNMRYPMAAACGTSVLMSSMIGYMLYDDMGAFLHYTLVGDLVLVLTTFLYLDEPSIDFENLLGSLPGMDDTDHSEAEDSDEFNFIM